MGEEMTTLASRVPVRVELADPDYDGAYEIRVWAGRLGGPIETLDVRSAQNGRLDFELPLVVGTQVVYLEVLQVGANRMAWTAPIWIERI